MRGEKHLRLATLALAAFLAFSALARAAEVTGKVVLSGTPTAGVVVSIEGLKAEGAPEPIVYGIDHRNLNFVPHVLVVRVGSTVQFKNSDGMPCRIYSISPAGIFVLGQQDGKPMSITFDRPGVVEVRCADHGRIYAYVVIKENSFFALTDGKGLYEISNVPPGRYTLQVWYEGAVVKSRTITVGTKRLHVDFRASRPRVRAQDGKVVDPTIFDSVAAALPQELPIQSRISKEQAR